MFEISLWLKNPGEADCMLSDEASYSGYARQFAAENDFFRVPFPFSTDVPFPPQHLGWFVVRRTGEEMILWWGRLEPNIFVKVENLQPVVLIPKKPTHTDYNPPRMPTR